MHQSKLIINHVLLSLLDDLTCIQNSFSPIRGFNWTVETSNSLGTSDQSSEYNLGLRRRKKSEKFHFSVDVWMASEGIVFI